MFAVVAIFVVGVLGVGLWRSLRLFVMWVVVCVSVLGCGCLLCAFLVVVCFGSPFR